ncbi:homeodomain-interacting protein kinase 1-like [Thalassophryne amazonica]|uniref:homeodomain-interacting protein kinase 1-like n=1 Tax=Thalassophryne amazonica TaxID=390379 RepID=UPI001471DD6E|nr:homeodomain-interacting protein kinase 1-like [Thalassophryne amazonica]
MADRKHSNVWPHFSKCDADYARYNICNAKCKTSGGNTSNLRKHLVKQKIFLNAEESTIFDCLRVRSAPEFGTACDLSSVASIAGEDTLVETFGDGNSDNDNSMVQDEWQGLKILVNENFRDKTYSGLWETMLTKEPYREDYKCSSCPPTDDFPIKEGDVLHSFYIVQEFIGEGSFGKVAKCRHNVTHEDVAIKISKNKPSIIKETKKEIANLKLLSALDPEKANIVRWYDAFMHKDLLCLKFELLHQSLLDYLDEMSFEPLPASDLRAVVQQMATALLHLETLGVIHCDIKPQNIMVVDNVQQPLKVKLIDFGLAQHISEPPSFAGTLSYQ